MEKYVLDDKYNNCIMIPGKNDNSLVINYDISDVCLSCTGYDNSNVFYITRSDQLYIPMKMLFRDIRKSDKLCYLSNNGLGTKFEWLSDGCKYAIQNRLVIIETSDGFRIQFIKNPNNKAEKDCTIRFSLIKSNNIDIAKSFDKFATGLMNMLSMNNNKKIKR